MNAICRKKVHPRAVFLGCKLLVTQQGRQLSPEMLSLRFLGSLQTHSGAPLCPFFHVNSTHSRTRRENSEPVSIPKCCLRSLEVTPPAVRPRHSSHPAESRVASPRSASSGETICCAGNRELAKLRFLMRKLQSSSC